LYVSAILVAMFVVWGLFSPSSLQEVASSALDWMINTFGWFYMLITAFFVLFVIVLAISPLGNIKLGKADDEPELDRKSTRLNSSHVSISYAVFCLKK